jgi:hypothetical protein
MNTEVFSEKIDHYNEAVRSELQWVNHIVA